MKNDIVDVFEACVDGTLDQVELDFEDNAAVCVVLASAGYPEHYDCLLYTSPSSRWRCAWYTRWPRPLRCR